MELFEDPDYTQEKEERMDLMRPYQLNHNLLRNSRAKVMHDMPINAGCEISRELVVDTRSIIFDQAENRLDAQKAMIIKLLDNSFGG